MRPLLFVLNMLFFFLLVPDTIIPIKTNIYAQTFIHSIVLSLILLLITKQIKTNNMFEFMSDDYVYFDPQTPKPRSKYMLEPKTKYILAPELTYMLEPKSKHSIEPNTNCDKVKDKEQQQYCKLNECNSKSDKKECVKNICKTYNENIPIDYYTCLSRSNTPAEMGEILHTDYVSNKINNIKCSDISNKYNDDLYVAECNNSFINNLYKPREQISQDTRNIYDNGCKNKYNDKSVNYYKCLDRNKLYEPEIIGKELAINLGQKIKNKQFVDNNKNKCNTIMKECNEIYTTSEKYNKCKNEYSKYLNVSCDYEKVPITNINNKKIIIKKKNRI